MELLVVNLAGAVRSVKKGGRDYLVADATLIVPGVLAGSKGALYYPPEEVAKRPEAWNGIPITVGHPVKNGRHVSGRDPEVDQIGHLYKSQIRNRDGALVSEAWFDVEATRRTEPRILEALQQKRPFGLSTGLFTKNDIAENGAHHNGRPYTQIARDYVPDHLAILLDQRGACSLKDGCGVLVNAEDGTESEIDPVLWDEFSGLVNLLVDEGGIEFEVVENGTRRPSAKLKMTPEKACKILKDGEVKGHPLTDAQKGMFGALCGKRADNAELGLNSNPAGCNQHTGPGCSGKSGRLPADPDSPLGKKLGSKGIAAGQVTQHQERAFTEFLRASSQSTGDVQVSFDKNNKGSLKFRTDPPEYALPEIKTWASKNGHTVEVAGGKFSDNRPWVYVTVAQDPLTQNELEDDVVPLPTFPDHDFTAPELLGNSNPKGCNQHTGPGCGSGAGDGGDEKVYGPVNPVSEKAHQSLMYWGWGTGDGKTYTHAMHGPEEITLTGHKQVGGGRKRLTFTFKEKSGKTINYEGMNILDSLLASEAKRYNQTRNEDESPTDPSLNFAPDPHEVVDMTLTAPQRQQIITNLVANCGCEHVGNTPWQGLNATALNAKTDDELYTMEQCRGMMAKTGKVANRAPVDPPAVPVANGSPRQTDRPQSFTEALATFGTAEEKAVWNSAVQIHNEKKAAMIDMIVNAFKPPTPDAQASLVSVYSAMPIDQLQQVANSLPRPAQAPAHIGQTHNMPNWFGVQGPVANHQQPTVNEQPLPEPTPDFSDTLPMRRRKSG